MNAHSAPMVNDWDRSGLPAWCYSSPAFLELEREHLFRTHWQVIGHVSDMPEKGDYLSLDVAGERALVVRGADGEIRGFHNMCRHRGSRVVTEEAGNCRNALVCPFHGWVYNLDGTLRGPARPRSFPELDKNKFGLVPIDIEVWMGLIFFRFEKGNQPSVASLLGGIAGEFGHYNTETMIPSGKVWSQVTPVNWKSVRDVDNEGYHVAMAHPALQDLYGSTYFDQEMKDGVSRSFATFNPHAGRRWSVRNYVKLLPEAAHLPEHLRKAWIYYGIFPNSVLSLTPGSMQFYQEFPLGPDQSLVRGAVYHYPVETRQQRTARYLAGRIDRDTTAEDVQLTIWSNESMKSKAFQGFYLSDLERGVRAYHDHVRKALPVSTLVDRPPEAEMAGINDTLRKQQFNAQP